MSFPLYDVIGVGFGPASLAVAVAFVEKRRELLSQGKQPPLQTLCFVEKYKGFAWHPGMLLPGSRMQISFLKDLATLRTPTSSYTFLSYLHEHDRLVTYINRGSFIPTRREYADYLAWAAAKIAAEDGITVSFGEQVLGIKKSESGVIVRSVGVDGEVCDRQGHHLLLAPGGSPRFPPSLLHLRPSPNIIHTSVYALEIDRVISNIASEPGTTCRIAVLGSGQSAAEVFLNLQSRLSSLHLAPGNAPHQVDLIIRRGSLKPSDDSPFANEIFDPKSTDFIYNLPSRTERLQVKREYESTNYGVVNPRTIDAIYEAVYDQRVEDGAHGRGAPSSIFTTPRLSIFPYRSVVAATCDPAASGSDAPSGGGGITLTLRHLLDTNQPDKVITYDAIVVGTGYERKSWINLLDESDFGGVFGFSHEEETKPSVAEGITEATKKSTNSVPLQAPVSTTLDVKRPLAMSLSFTPTLSSADSTSPAMSRSETLFGTLSEENSTRLSMSRLHSPATSPPSSRSQSPSPSSVATSTTSSLSPMQQIKISRAYRLLPTATPEGNAFKPRVYIQGIAEETHGLSDSLLSVLSVRGGEVVDDLFLLLDSEAEADCEESHCE